MISAPVRKFKQNFSAAGFLVMLANLVLAVLLHDTSKPLSVFFDVVGIFLFFVYVYLYLKVYRSNSDIIRLKTYYLSVYTNFPVMLLYNIIFLLMLAHVLFNIGSISSGFWSVQKVAYLDVVGLSFQHILNIPTLGLFDCFDLKFTSISITPVWGKAILYCYTLSLQWVFYEWIIDEYKDRKVVRAELQKLKSGEALNVASFRHLDHNRISKLKKEVTRTDGVSDTTLKHVFDVLKIHTETEAKDLILQIMHKTEDMELFRDCVFYFDSNKYGLFKRSLKRIKNKNKVEILATVAAGRS